MAEPTTIAEPAAEASADRIAAARRALATVADPELTFLSIADLGMLRDVRLAPDGRTLEVVLTPTYMGCPATDVIRLDVELALTKAGLEPFKVSTALHPPWTTDWLTDEARDKLAANGIAPPARNAALHRGALREVEGLACPKCGSDQVELVSPMGSTRCKAHYRCRACREPFEHFKCH